MASGYPMSDEDARKYVNYFKFDAHYLKTRGVDADYEGDPDRDPKRAELPAVECDGYGHDEGFICWHCDTVPRRLPEGTLTIEVGDDGLIEMRCGDAEWRWRS